MIRELVVTAARSGVCADQPRLGALRREFPTIRITADAAGSRATTFRIEEWADDGADLFRFDERVDAERPAALGLVAGAESWFEAAAQILTRYQWLVCRRNGQSSTTFFDRLLARHLGLHDAERPLVRADLVHALDRWQWMLRLDPGASLPAQIAALFHDVERLVSEPDERIEHRAGDYRAFKRAHAREGARMLRVLLEELGAPPHVIERSAQLVERHEEPGADRELRLLNDADALSFLSRSSDEFVRYYGVEHTRAKVRFTLGRLGSAARARLRGIRLRPDIRRMVDEARAAEPIPPRSGE